MREPGARRRNPLFDAVPDDHDRAGEGGHDHHDDHSGHGGHDHHDDHDDSGHDHGWGAEHRDREGAGEAIRGAGIDSAVVDLARALQGAQPEAAEHLVAAAHELVLAVKTVVDAAESSLAAQRSALAAARRSTPDPHADEVAGTADPDTAGGPRPAPGAATTRRPRVRPIDLA
ncbi:MAG: hypothetical protein KJ056_10760 [Acidimicrobiia bacterium]|nr:hypothetical protein [Acidimicrobiia bacterium]